MMTHLAVQCAAAMVEPPLPVIAEFDWSPADALAMTLSLRVDTTVAWVAKMCGGPLLNETIVFEFARELLGAAVMDPGVEYGEGDVSFYVVDRSLYVTVTGVAGKKHPIVVDLPPVQKMVVESYVITPAQYAHVDVDGTIEQILGGQS